MALTQPVPFPYDIDWSERFIEVREHETTIQEMWNGAEQRRNLSEVPNRQFSYRILALEIEHDEFQRLQAALYGGHALEWWVPYWPRERRISAPVSIGATSIPTGSTTHLGYAADQAVLFYRSPARYEVTLVTAVNPTDVTISPTTLDWTTRDKIVPCFRALMSPETEIVTLDVHLASTRVTFDLVIAE